MTSHLFAAFQTGLSHPGKPVMTPLNGPAMTGTDLATGSARLAHWLTAKGVVPGDRVAVQVEKSVQSVLLYLACLRVGAVFLPLNPAYTAAEVGYFLTDAAPEVFVCDPARVAALMPIAKAAGVTHLATLDATGSGSMTDEAAALPADFIDAARGPDDLAAILYTSGTTGRSKGAMMTHENLASNARTLVEIWKITEDDRLIHALPIYHTHGLFVALNTSLIAGAEIRFLPKFDGGVILDLMPTSTMLMGVPTFYTRLLADPRLTPDRAANMRLFISGSAPLLAETHVQWRARTGHAILERYGMTETNMITSNPYDGDRRAGTVGFALPGVALRVADAETGAALPQGGIGSIELTGPNVFAGYWNMPEKTAEEFRDDGFFKTGDLGRITAEGYLELVGRAKDLIISGGFNVYPIEVEAEIDQLEGVLESAVIGLTHPDLGEAVCAVVVPKPGITLVERDLAAGLAERLARFKQPKKYFIRAELPRNAMGKVQKALLRQTLSLT